MLSDLPAKVKWFRNKKQITEESDKYRFDEEGDSHSLLVTDAVLRDSGMYEATAENQRGLTKIVGKLLVKCESMPALSRWTLYVNMTFHLARAGKVAEG